MIQKITENIRKTYKNGDKHTKNDDDDDDDDDNDDDAIQIR